MDEKAEAQKDDIAVLQLVGGGAGLILRDRMSPKSFLLLFLYHLMDKGREMGATLMGQRTRPPGAAVRRGCAVLGEGGGWS